MPADQPIRVFMMDLLCTVPYYTGHLCDALSAEQSEITLGSINYHLDPDYFSGLLVRRVTGFSDLTGRAAFAPLLRRLIKLIEYVFNLLALAFRFRKAAPDVLHVQYLPLIRHGLPIELWFLRYARKRGAAVVYTVHNLLPQDTGLRYLERFKRLYHSVDLLICHNETTRKLLVDQFGIPSSRILTIPHGPLFQRRSTDEYDSARKHLGVSREQCMVLWQGFIRPYKGVPFLLDAWAALQPERLNARLFIVGDGDPQLLEEIRGRIRDAGIEDTVTCTFRFVPVEEMERHYQAADLVAYPYREITTSGALLTGLSYEKPLVATSLPTFREFLAPSKRAVLVDYGDIQGMAEALRRLITDPNERGLLAADLAQLKPSWAAIANQTIEAYRLGLRLRSAECPSKTI